MTSHRPGNDGIWWRLRQQPEEYLPVEIAALARRVLREEVFGGLLAAYPWVEVQWDWGEG